MSRESYLHLSPRAKRCWSLWISFLVVLLLVLYGMAHVVVPDLVCRLPDVGAAKVEFVDTSEYLALIDTMSCKSRFFGVRAEVEPQELQLPQWDEMDFVEPDFIIP